jgi:hypothetical protein
MPERRTSSGTAMESGSGSLSSRSSSACCVTPFKTLTAPRKRRHKRHLARGLKLLFQPLNDVPQQLHFSRVCCLSCGGQMLRRGQQQTASSFARRAAMLSCFCAVSRSACGQCVQRRNRDRSHLGGLDPGLSLSLSSGLRTG